MKAKFACVLLLLFTCRTAYAGEAGWMYYGGDEGGQRYSSAKQITPANVRNLAVTWTYSTGILASKGEAMKAPPPR